MTSINVHIRQINHFLAVIEQGSLGRAATKLHISQPALSKSIHQLEQRLAFTLLERSPQGVTPTVYGNAFAQHARTIRSEMVNALSYMNALRGVRAGVVAVGAGPSVASGILPAAVVRLHRAHPDIGVSVVEGLTDGLVKGLLCGELDVVISGKLAVEDPDSLEQTRLYPDRCVIVCRRQHPILTKPLTALAELKDYPWMLTAKNDGMRRLVEEFFLKHDLTPPRVVVSSDSIAFTRTLLKDTDHLSFLPLAMLQTDVDAGHLDYIKHPDCTWNRWIYVAHRRKRSLSPLSRALIHELEICARDLGGIRD